MIKRVIVAMVVVFLGMVSLYAQPVYERHTSEVYNYLSRMAQKGVLIFDDVIRPLSKNQIKKALDSVSAHVSQLTTNERKELDFYEREFTEGVRKRILGSESADFTIQADPIVTGSAISGSGKSIKESSIGINLWGRIGKGLGYQLSFHDVNESGAGIDSFLKTQLASSATGTVPIGFRKPGANLNYTDIRANLRYEFKNGAISVGQDYLLYGYGENGRTVLSDKAPTYPYIRLDYQPFSWLRFNYTHAWLKSDVLDSNRSYPISGPIATMREVFIPKFMASHSLDFTIMKGLNFAIGESIIYTDELNIGYLIPIMFFKAYDNYVGSGSITRGSNGQFFFQLNSRNLVRNTHFYGSLFIDEIKMGSMFDKEKQRNQLGYSVGASITDFLLPYLTLGTEYTRIRPFVYRNFLPAQNYTSSSYLLGDWMGSNADRVSVLAKYTAIPRLKISLMYSYIRKGGDGTLDQQYNIQQPQPPFLFELQQKSDEVLFKTSYEFTYRLYFQMGYRRLDKDNSISFGLTYGL